MSHLPDVQPIASLTPSADIPAQAVPADLSGSPTQWSGAIVDVYA
jgi:hypothetical protein